MKRCFLLAGILAASLFFARSELAPRTQAAVTLVAGAGDITANDHAGDATAAQVRAVNPDGAITLGDNQYPDGCLSDFNGSGGYGQSWGTFFAKTRPAVGNHDAHNNTCTPTKSFADGYFDYFNGVGSGICTPQCKAGQRDQGWYSYDIGGWHVVVLNSECNGADVNTDFCDHNAQLTWLTNDLLAHPATCTLAYWHRPLFAPSSTHANDEGHLSTAGGNNVWQILYDKGVDLVLQGHDHVYAQFPRLNRDGIASDATGIRSFIVGTGGSGLYSGNDSPVPLDAYDTADHGVFKLTLHPTQYDWAFLPTDGSYGGTGSATGSETCRGASPDTDGDSWIDSDETIIGTDPTKACGVGAWPADINDSGYVDITDVSFVTGYFGHATTNNGGDAPIRYDLAPSPPNRYVDISDIARVTNFFGATCLITYYIDPAGNNMNDGLTANTPWADFQNIAQHPSGAAFLLKRGGSWSVPLTLSNADLIRVDAYGDSALPIIDTAQASDCVQVVNSKNITVRNVQAQHCAYAGFAISGNNSRNVTLDGVAATHNIAGVQLKSGLDASTFTHVQYSQIVSNDRLSPSDLSSGAFGVLVNGGKLLMEENVCNGQDVVSTYFGGRDGSCLEFYGAGGGSIVRKNRADNNDAFVESTHPTTPTNSVTYVQNYISGAGAHMIGLNIGSNTTGTVALSNTIWLPTGGTGNNNDLNRGGQGILGGAGLTLRNNIVHGGWKDVYVPSAPASEGYNDFIGVVQGFSPAATDKTADPQLTSATDEHLLATSPMIEAGDPADTEVVYSFHGDFDGQTVPLDGDCNGTATRDIGVDEYKNPSC